MPVKDPKPPGGAARAGKVRVETKIRKNKKVTCQVSAAEAVNDFSSLLKRVGRGERITITHYNKPVADLVPPAEPAYPERRFGTGKGKVIIIDPDWARGVETEEELEAWLRGEF